MIEVQMKDANQSLSGLLAGLRPGEEVAVVDNGKRITVIRKEPEQDFACKAGSATGTILHIAEDFDAPLDDFAESMQ